MNRKAIGIYGMVPIALLQDKKARGHVAVYAALSSFQGGAERCFPGYAAIAERAGCSRRQAMDSVKALADTGWIEKVSKGHTGRANEYVVLTEVLETEPIQADSEVDCTTEPVEGVKYPAPPSEVDCTPGVKCTAPQKNIEKEHIKDDEEKPLKSVEPIDSAAAPVESSSFELWFPIIEAKARKVGHYLNPSAPIRKAYENLKASALTLRFDYIDSLLDKYRDKPTGHLIRALQTLEDRPRELFTPAGAIAAPPPPERHCVICGAVLTRDRCERCDFIDGTTGDELEGAKVAYADGGAEAVKVYLAAESAKQWDAIHAALTA